LRGALAVIMVLMIPDDLTIAGWSYSLSIKEFLLVLVIGAIYFTLFVKGLTIRPLIKKLKISKLEDIEKLEY
jgi:CPA1 family monovalent cation:H+ antiporter